MAVLVQFALVTINAQVALARTTATTESARAVRSIAQPAPIPSLALLALPTHTLSPTEIALPAVLSSLDA